jgi:hypothetical protein
MSFSYVYNSSNLVLPQRILSGLGIEPDGVVSYNGTGVIIEMPYALSVEEKTALDDLMFEQQYVPSDLLTYFHRSFSVSSNSVNVSSLTWVDIGTFVVSPMEIIRETSKCLFQISGSFITSGTGAKLRIVEDDLNGTQRDLLSTDYEFADSTSNEQMFNISTDLNLTSSSNQFVYRVQAKVILLTSLSIQSCTVAALESLI